MREPYLGDVPREETDNFMKFMDIYLILEILATYSFSIIYESHVMERSTKM